MALYLVCFLNFLGYMSWLFVFTLLPEDKHSESRIQVKLISRLAKVHSIVPGTENMLGGECLRTQALPLTTCVTLGNFLNLSMPYFPYL